MDLNIVPECHGDTVFIETLVPPKLRYSHIKGKPNVINLLARGKLKNEFAIGIIDKDKDLTNHKYLNEFELIDKIEDNLELYKHKFLNQYFVFIIPAIEKFILKISTEIGLDLSEHFEQKIDLNKLMNIIKTDSVKDNIKVRSLYKKIKESDNHSINKLIYWLKMLKEQRGTVSQEVLKAEEWKKN